MKDCTNWYSLESLHSAQSKSVIIFEKFSSGNVGRTTGSRTGHLFMICDQSILISEAKGFVAERHLKWMVQVW